MKRILHIGYAVGLMGVLLAPAQAQQYGYESLLAGGTNNIAATSTNTYTGKVATLTKYDQAGVDILVTGNAGATGNMTFHFLFGADGTNFDPANTLTMTVALNGTNVACAATNVTMGSLGYIQLNQSKNTTSYVGTNVTVRVWQKPKRQG